MQWEQGRVLNFGETNITEEGCPQGLQEMEVPLRLSVYNSRGLVRKVQTGDRFAGLNSFHIKLFNVCSVSVGTVAP